VCAQHVLSRRTYNAFMRFCTLSFAYTYTHMHMLPCIHSHTRTYTYMHIHTFMRPHAYTTYMHMRISLYTYRPHECRWLEGQQRHEGTLSKFVITAYGCVSSQPRERKAREDAKSAEMKKARSTGNTEVFLYCGGGWITVHQYYSTVRFHSAFFIFLSHYTLYFFLVCA